MFGWLFGKKKCKHDWDMQFPDPRSMNWKFVCLKCGKERHGMPMLDEL